MLTLRVSWWPTSAIASCCCPTTTYRRRRWKITCPLIFSTIPTLMSCCHRPGCKRWRRLLAPEETKPRMTKLKKVTPKKTNHFAEDLSGGHIRVNQDPTRGGNQTTKDMHACMHSRNGCPRKKRLIHCVTWLWRWGPYFITVHTTFHNPRGQNGLCCPHHQEDNLFLFIWTPLSILLDVLCRRHCCYYITVRIFYGRTRPPQNMWSFLFSKTFREN